MLPSYAKYIKYIHACHLTKTSFKLAELLYLYALRFVRKSYECNTVLWNVFAHWTIYSQNVNFSLMFCVSTHQRENYPDLVILSARR